MLNERFEKIINAQLDFCRDMLTAKGDEYATADRLHNFRQAARLSQTDMKQALGGMMIKHTISIYDMIYDEENPYELSKWTEKITDHINYLLLLKAVVTELNQTLEQPRLFDMDEITDIIHHEKY